MIKVNCSVQENKVILELKIYGCRITLAKNSEEKNTIVHQILSRPRKFHKRKEDIKDDFQELSTSVSQRKLLYENPNNIKIEHTDVGVLHEEQKLGASNLKPEIEEYDLNKTKSVIYHGSGEDWKEKKPKQKESEQEEQREMKQEKQAEIEKKEREQSGLKEQSEQESEQEKTEEEKTEQEESEQEKAEQEGTDEEESEQEDSEQEDSEQEIQDQEETEKEESEQEKSENEKSEQEEVEDNEKEEILYKEINIRNSECDLLSDEESLCYNDEIFCLKEHKNSSIKPHGDTPNVSLSNSVDCATQTDEVYIIETTSKGIITPTNFQDILNGALNLVNMIVSAKDSNENERRIMIREHGKMLENRVKKNNEEMKHIMLQTYHDLGEVFSKSMTYLEGSYEETIYRV